MKTIIITIGLILVTLVSYGQLNSSATFLKENRAESYKDIKFMAVLKWDNNHNMIIHEINKEADAKLEVGKITKDANYDEELLLNAMVKWSETIGGKLYYDYSMVVYEYKKQIKAKESY